MKLVVDKDFVEIQDITRQDYKELSKVFECPIPNALQVLKSLYLVRSSEEAYWILLFLKYMSGKQILT